MRQYFTAIIALGLAASAVPALAADEQWKDGVLFAEKDVARLQGHTGVRITFGLEPGKCTGELTAPAEWLKMTEGTLSFAYTGEGDVERGAGTVWFHDADTKVEVCNKTDGNAVLVGVQFRSN